MTDPTEAMRRAAEIERDGSRFFMLSVYPRTDGRMEMRWYADLTVVTNQDGMMGTVDLYRCKDCAAITDEPSKHIAWHQAKWGES